jgi:arsenate reductase
VDTYQPGDGWGALADTTRRAIVACLAEGPLPVGELAARLPVSRPAVSQHLKVLKDAGLVTERAVGTRRIYRVNPAAVAAMREVGVDITGETPRRWTEDAVRTADVVVTMGCGDTCPVFPGKRYEDWTLDDPAGRDVPAGRPIRDEIERRVRALLADLHVAAAR